MPTETVRTRDMRGLRRSRESEAGIAELDRWAGHSTRTAFREDRVRDRRLTAAGYTVTHITWNQLDDEPEEIASDLRRLLLD